MTAAGHTVESLAAEIEQMVGERQRLRAEAAAAHELEHNRRRLVDAHALMSRLLIGRYLPQAAAA